MLFITLAYCCFILDLLCDLLFDIVSPLCFACAASVGGSKAVPLAMCLLVVLPWAKEPDVVVAVSVVVADLVAVVCCCCCSLLMLLL